MQGDEILKKELFINTIKASTKAIKCDLVIKNITIIDVFNKKIHLFWINRCSLSYRVKLSYSI
ncbi:hypothetical protein CNEO4_330072 [Clostridium neonatale]|nr:hypothetical protein CNEO4_330072 [Clostridium neonatale]